MKIVSYSSGNESDKLGIFLFCLPKVTLYFDNFSLLYNCLFSLFVQVLILVQTVYVFLLTSFRTFL